MAEARKRNFGDWTLDWIGLLLVIYFALLL
jgi:hypothetical protein